MVWSFCCLRDSPVQTVWSLLQDCSLKTSILWSWGFFMVQLSHPYMTTGKTVALTIWIFVGKVMSLLFNMLSRFVIAFLPWNNLDTRLLYNKELCWPLSLVLGRDPLHSWSLFTVGFSDDICLHANEVTYGWFQYSFRMGASHAWKTNMWWPKAGGSV